MGQALRKLRGGGRASSAAAPAPKKAQQLPSESRFQDPTLRGHLPGDVRPDTPYPFVAPQDKEREWDRSDPVYSTMVKDLAGSVVMTQGPKGASKDLYMRRPLPKIRHSVNAGFEEDRSVPPGTLNVGHIRQVFLSYQGLREGEKPMSVEALAKKYDVDAVLLERVVCFHALPDKKGEDKSVKDDSQSAAQLE